MKVLTGNLLSSEVIYDMLNHVPKSDLRGLRKIQIMLRPPRNERYRYGLGDYHYGKRTARVFLWSIRQSVERHMHHDNNYYHQFLIQIAKTLYHEIGHHHHYIKGKGKHLSERHDLLEEQKKNSNSPVSTARLSNEMFSIHSEMEDYADNYMEEKINLYYPIRPSFRKIRFIKIFREKWVDRNMHIFRQSKKFYYQDLIVIWHLRKSKISKHPLYSISELCYQLNHYFYCHRNLKRSFMAKVKRASLKIQKPVYYVSKSGRKYPYFTQKQVNKLLMDKKLAGLGREIEQACNSEKGMS